MKTIRQFAFSAPQVAATTAVMAGAMLAATCIPTQAQGSKQQTFATAGEASRALFTAIEKHYG